MKKLSRDEKRTLAQYLIDDWSLCWNKEKEALLQAEIDVAFEADANGESIRWKNTPSLEAVEILNDILIAKKENPMLKSLKKVYGKHGANALLALAEGKETPLVHAMSQRYNYYEKEVLRGLLDAGILFSREFGYPLPGATIIETNIAPRGGVLGRRWRLKEKEDVDLLKNYLEKICQDEER